jgi:hypothetical protein
MFCTLVPQASGLGADRDEQGKIFGIRLGGRQGAIRGPGARQVGKVAGWTRWCRCWEDGEVCGMLMLLLHRYCYY